MHQQIRAVAQISPPDLVPFLQVLKDAGVSLVGLAGGGLELGGEVAIATLHDQFQTAYDALELKGYKPRKLEEGDPGFTVCSATHQAGGLLECLESTAAINLNQGRVIKDILIGIEPEDGKFCVQIYSVEVKTESNRRA